METDYVVSSHFAMMAYSSYLNQNENALSRTFASSRTQCNCGQCTFVLAFMIKDYSSSDRDESGCTVIGDSSSANTGQPDAANEEIEEVEDKLSKEAENEFKAGKKALRILLNPVFIEAFLLTFSAEWGDRSQIATIALAAHKNP